MPSLTARHGVVRALARSTTKLSSTPSTAPRRSLVSFRLPPAVHKHQLRRKVTSPTTRGAWSVVESPHQLMQQQMQQQRRSFASGKEDDDSDDDFKPKRKEVPDDSDEVSDLIEKQVQQALPPLVQQSAVTLTFKCCCCDRYTCFVVLL